MLPRSTEIQPCVAQIRPSPQTITLISFLCVLSRGCLPTLGEIFHTLCMKFSNTLASISQVVMVFSVIRRLTHPTSKNLPSHICSKATTPRHEYHSLIERLSLKQRVVYDCVRNQISTLGEISHTLSLHQNQYLFLSHNFLCNMYI